MWMKARSYSDSHVPSVSDVTAYSENWISWWTACQPSWRQGKGWPLPREHDGRTSWGKLTTRGQNGMFILVVSTTWWATSLKSAGDRGAFDEAVDDIRWVLEQLLESVPSPNTLNVPLSPPLTPTEKPVPTAAAATWQARSGGKRQSKPTRKLLESLA